MVSSDIVGDAHADYLVANQPVHPHSTLEKNLAGRSEKPTDDFAKFRRVHAFRQRSGASNISEQEREVYLCPADELAALYLTDVVETGILEIRRQRTLPGEAIYPESDGITGGARYVTRISEG